MSDAVSGVSALRQSVLIHEEVKVVIRNCFEINLMGLNAILLAKKAGESARGFGVISSELRLLSIELQTAMQRLSALTQELLAAATQRLQVERRLARLSDASAHSEHIRTILAPAMQQAHSRLSNLVAASRFDECLADANRACTFGLVLARSARIESAYSGQMRSVLAELSETFAHKIEAILPRLDSLQRITHTLN
jgi:Methyl-accepting chemotaxis protein (MCP) signalling domain